MSVNYYTKKEHGPESPSSATEERLAAYVDSAREAKARPPTKNLWKAVAASDLASTAAWVVAGEKTGAKLMKMFGGRAGEGSDALALAAALGWTDGVRLLLGTPSIPSDLHWRALPLLRGALENSEWWPRRAGEPAAKTSEFPQWAKIERFYTPLGFALVNEETDAAKILVNH